MGSGRATATHVDLPLQRDEFNFPTIWASSLKGAFRANYQRNGCRNDVEWKAIFGAEPEKATIEEPSAISLLDARLLLIPARIIKGVWAYMTSPHMLNQFKLYADVANIESSIDIPDLSDAEAIVNSRNLLYKDNKTMVNETDLEAKVNDKIINDIFPDKLFPHELKKKLQDKGLIIVPDDIARDLVNRSLVIQYRVRLNEKKVVEEGPWSEEYLPAESILVSMIVSRRAKIRYSKCGSKERDADAEPKEIYEKVKSNFSSINNTMFIGGRETIGKGLIKIYFIDGVQ